MYKPVFKRRVFENFSAEIARKEVFGLRFNANVLPIFQTDFGISDFLWVFSDRSWALLAHRSHSRGARTRSDASVEADKAETTMIRRADTESIGIERNPERRDPPRADAEVRGCGCGSCVGLGVSVGCSSIAGAHAFN